MKNAPDSEYRPVFLSAKRLDQFIPPSLKVALSHPVLFHPKRGGGVVYGLRATLLPEICEVLLKARRHGVVLSETIVQKAEQLVSALAKVGIIALVDEATGYQYVRERDELRQILEAYVSDEWLPWTMRFPTEFYKELFRLRGWQFNPQSNKRPARVGSDTVYIIYDRLPPGILDELRRRNPKLKPGYARYKHHQFLTGDIGNPHLMSLVATATAFMRASKTWKGFCKLLESGVPRPTTQTSLEELDFSFRRDVNSDDTADE